MAAHTHQSCDASRCSPTWFSTKKKTGKTTTSVLHFRDAGDKEEVQEEHTLVGPTLTPHLCSSCTRSQESGHVFRKKVVFVNLRMTFEVLP